MSNELACTLQRVYEQVGVDWFVFTYPRVFIKKNLLTEGWQLHMEGGIAGMSFVGTLKTAEGCMLVADYLAKECYA